MTNSCVRVPVMAYTCCASQVWLMAATSKGYTLSRDHVNLVLTIVQQVSCATQFDSVLAASLHADAAPLGVIMQECWLLNAAIQLVQIAAVPVRDSSRPAAGPDDSQADADAAADDAPTSDQRLAAIDAEMPPGAAAHVKVPRSLQCCPAC